MNTEILECQRAIAEKYGYSSFEELLKGTHDRETDIEKRLELFKYIIDEVMNLAIMAGQNEMLNWAIDVDNHESYGLCKDVYEGEKMAILARRDEFLKSPIPFLIKSKWKIGKGIQIFETDPNYISAFVDKYADKFAIAYARWLSNQVIGGRTYEVLFKEFKQKAQNGEISEYFGDITKC